MPVSLSVKDVPEAMAETLRARAAAHHRSLQGELMAILEAAARDSLAAAVPPPAAVQAADIRGTLTIEESLVRLRKIFPVPVPDPVGAARIVREMRDTRYGEGWLQTGRHVAARRKPARRVTNPPRPKAR
jgi:plasmid stability protein